MKSVTKIIDRIYDFLHRWLWWLFIKIPADFYIRNQAFSCTRCGFCCERYIVFLYPEDIQRMDARGYKNYSQYINGKPFLRRENDSCIFFKKENCLSTCTIHTDVRPRLCHEFPAIKGPFGLTRNDSRCKAFKTPFWFIYS